METEIRDQVYDMKNSKVTIKVWCCNPEKLRDKLCCKGGKVIKSIQIVEDPPKPKEAEKPKAPEKAPEKPKEAEKPKAPEKPKEEKPKAPEKPKEEAEKPKAPEKPKEAEKPTVPKAPEAPEPRICGPIQGYPPIPLYPTGTCCGPCSQGYGGGPCYHGYGRPVPPPPGPCYDYGRPFPPPPGPCYDYGYGYRGSRCCVNTDYFSDENSQGCTIM